MTDFKGRIAKVYQEKVIKPLEKRVRAVALKVDSELVNTTPVDTGRARANWLPTLNIPANYSNASLTPQSPEDVTKAFKITDTIYITNNLPYINRLNDGYSQKAPAGFVQMAIAKGKRILKR